MNDITMNKGGILFYFSIILLGLLWFENVQAHRLKLFASAQGLEIKGSVYFAGGVSVKEISVDIYFNETKIAQVTTDSQGQFSYLASHSGDYQLVANAGSGHVARFRVQVTEASETAPDVPVALRPSPVQTATEAIENAQVDQYRHDMEVAHLERALQPLHAQLFELQKQIDAYEAKIRWHDILGGLGYIFGVAGLWLWWQTRCFSLKNKNGEDPSCTSQKVR
ncbi:hypothetical protein [Thioflexithrix psekupsensis]|uniref:Uncharacterized protein n=1 Tax=Thioflexithrix psekupsensis TaxID=1570016 RepID=A0A251XAF6_9GAMM|nr:hypothetical protein [Thioflexithrix psekupsensis]OUD15018.1 hypothetical protein TPSD3_04785 [Thioflexithrix psekupsensis]